MGQIVILTGAGISAESGLGTFRDKGGLWAKFNPAELASPRAFAKDPARVHEFYNLRRTACVEAEPNAAHLALAKLERDYPASTLVDDALWERALALRQAEDLAAACRALRELTRRFSSSKYAARGRALAGELRCEGGPP